MTPGKIDDPVDASFEAWREESPTLADKMLALALPFAGFVSPHFKVIQILIDRFSSKAKLKRIAYLLNALRIGFGRLASEVSDVSEQTKLIAAKLQDERFSDAVSAACEETSRAVKQRTIERMASLLVGFVAGSADTWSAPDEDISVMIRDISQLSERDIHVLRILATIHEKALSFTPNLQDPHQFSKETRALMTAIGTSGIHRDDFLSTCERLRGFGLAAEVLRNTSHMGPEDFCYRPTRRGMALLGYLKNGEKFS